MKRRVWLLCGLLAVAVVVWERGRPDVATIDLVVLSQGTLVGQLDSPTPCTVKWSSESPVTIEWHNGVALGDKEVVTATQLRWCLPVADACAGYIHADGVTALPIQVVLPSISGGPAVKGLHLRVNVRHEERGCHVESPLGDSADDHHRHYSLQASQVGYLVYGPRQALRRHAAGPISARLQAVVRAMSRYAHVSQQTIYEFPSIDSRAWPNYTSWGSPVVVTGDLRTEPELRRAIQAIAWSAMPDLHNSAAPWLTHGLAELLADRVTEELASAPTRLALEARKMHRQSFFEARAPFDYALNTGPTDLRQRRHWERMVCPLLLGASLQRAGMDIDTLVHALAEGRAMDLSPPELVERDLITASARSNTPTSDILSGLVGDLPQGKALQILTTSYTGGFLETCGCAVNQSGGAARRSSILTDNHGATTLRLDLGRRFGRASHTPGNALSAREVSLLEQLFAGRYYDILVPSVRDLEVYAKRKFAGIPSHVACCNVVPFDNKEVSPRSYRILQRGTHVIACIGITWPDWKIDNYDHGHRYGVGDAFYLSDPIRTLGATLATMSAERSDIDLVMVAGQIPHPMAREIVRRYPSVGIVVTSSNADWRMVGDRLALDVNGSYHFRERPIVVARTEVYAVAEVTIDLQGAPQLVRQEPVQLTEDVADDPVARSLITKFYKEAAPLQEWSVAPLREGNAGPGYVGSPVCATCHQGIYNTWRPSRHGQAYNTILDVQRHFVPECVKCHVVGMGEDTGFRPDGHDEGLRGVGCEACHGGGAQHIVAPSRNNIRRVMRKSDCGKCHDAEHSPAFATQYSEYLEKIRHW